MIKIIEYSFNPFYIHSLANKTIYVCLVPFTAIKVLFVCSCVIYYYPHKTISSRLIWFGLARRDVTSDRNTFDAKQKQQFSFYRKWLLISHNVIWIFNCEDGKEWAWRYIWWSEIGSRTKDVIDGTVMNRTLPLFLLLIVGFYISWNIVHPFILKMRFFVINGWLKE